MCQQLGQLVCPDYVTQGGLCRKHDSQVEVLNFEDSFLGVPDHPETDCIDVDGNRVLCKGGFGAEIRRAYAHIDGADNAFDNRDDKERAGAFKSTEFAEPQDDGTFPLIGDFDAEKADICNKGGENNNVDIPLFPRAFDKPVKAGSGQYNNNGRQSSDPIQGCCFGFQLRCCLVLTGEALLGDFGFAVFSHFLISFPYGLRFLLE